MQDDRQGAVHNSGSHPAPCSFNRREKLKFLLGGLSAVGMSGCVTAASSPAAASPAPATVPEGTAIDVHAHFVPEFYRDASIAAGIARPDGMPGYPAWSAEEMIAVMDRQKIARSILSISSPGIYFGDEAQARQLARDVNQEAAGLTTRYPGRFGFFASLPLPDLDASLAEIDFAFDTLHADGVVLLSNSDGSYLGDPGLDPLLEALDRRGAVVFLHPTSPACSCGVGPAGSALPAPILEFMFETTRAVTKLVYAGVPERFPNIRFIIPHGGAAIPALADRIAFAAAAIPSVGDLPPDQVLKRLSTFYYDLAGAPLPRQLPALRSFADDSRLLYGSDWPYTPEPLVARLKGALEQGLSDEPALLAAIRHANAESLFAFGHANQP